MHKRISLGLAIHNHQPVGNFPFVFADLYQKVYEPMVALLERHPRIRLAMHYSGPLLDWLDVERPELLERLAALVKREQVEIMTGAYYEPILPMIPDRDKLAQVVAYTAELRRRFGCEPSGLWPKRPGGGRCAGRSRFRGARSGRNCGGRPPKPIWW